ncbi:hypothetical protein AbraCBS73388_005585 [Aspergillus brasiliensis]|uniref:Major facilitator superfamily (MFS) profile domain-containing protein n=1 Tax=Aspergillus brasiliensis TaxID=319629 RepID=A0A9W6DK74_9EURO|nr:hypothetical protein AbraCBS73388_005585 [Aspergillus brasiliensis]
MAEDKLSPSSLEVEHVPVEQLSTSHREFLLAHHGTLDLVPLPTDSPNDPLNWPSWRKHVIILLVSFHAMMCLFMGAGIIPAYKEMAEEMGVSLQSATYFTSMQIIMLGLSRLLVAFFISPAMALGPEVVTQIFFSAERGQKMGFWTLMVTLGPSLGPLLMSFVAFHVGWRWIFWIFTIINFVQFVLYLLLSPETSLSAADPHPQESTLSFRARYFRFHRLSQEPLKPADFFIPLTVARHHVIWVTTVAYSIIFNFAFVLLSVEIPQIYEINFHLNTQEVGLQFLGMIIGGIIGEQAAGPLGDFLMSSFAKRHNGQRAQPEYRLWLSYLGYATVIAGFLIWGFRTADDELQHHYEVSPIVGIGISSFGAQVITTSVFTYVVDCYPGESAEIGIFANVVRQVWGFIGPFWFPSMFRSVGIKGSAGIMVGVTVVASLLPIIGVQCFGRGIRGEATVNLEAVVDRGDV